VTGGDGLLLNRAADGSDHVARWQGCRSGALRLGAAAAGGEGDTPVPAAARILGRVATQVLKRVLVWVVVSALAFWLLYWVVAVGLTIIVGIGVLVSLLSLDWDAHSTYEQREAERARRRQERYDRTAGKRAKDRARYEAAKAAEERRQARKAGLG
jgi:hypothetical protein